jgi:NDP-sugar pyrophosphorylase family protein
MRALLLAAGRGERLLPLTAHQPKVMVRVGGKPTLQYNVETLSRAGIRQAAINLHYGGDQIKDYFGDGAAFGMNLTYIQEDELLGTAGATLNARDFLGENDFVVAYGDNVSTIDISKLVALHQQSAADLTMALYERRDARSSGVADVDAADRIIGFKEKPSAAIVGSSLVNAGYYVVSNRVLNMIPRKTPSDYGRDVIPAILSAGMKIQGYRMNEKLWWIDTRRDYERASAELAHDLDC